MKMEISVTATNAGIITKILCSEGMSISAGQNLLIIAGE
jgi:biotin carboxyl carrier protein